MSDFNERSAYPSPDEFRVMRPEYSEVQQEGELVRASITIAPFRVTGESTTKAGARRAALYDAEKTYRSYHPSYRIESPFSDSFIDADGTRWQRVPAKDREKLGDYFFTTTDGEEDSSDIESMLAWDVRPVGEPAVADDEG